MSESQIPQNPEFSKTALINSSRYEELYKASLSQPEEFWDEQAQRIDWIQPWTRVSETSFDRPVNIKWFLDGKLNACYNCVDRHLPEHADRVAFYWEPDHPENPGQTITYQNLYDQVGRWSNLLRKHGVQKGDRVTIYMPMIPEAIYSVLACARIGAVHSVVFAGFSPKSLAERINDCDSHFLITSDEGRRGGKTIPLKHNAIEATQLCPDLKKLFVFEHTQGASNLKHSLEVNVIEELKSCSTESPLETMDAEDPLFILYTSGSTNKPKGVLHTTGGYLVYASLTHQYVFDYKPEDTYWCAADIGWITGHSYIVYGPLSNAATSVLFEGVPTWPDCSRLWQIVDKHQVNTLYTAPTLIRALMREGDALLQSSSRDSLRLLGSVGEPINPEAWSWYHKSVGKEKCPIVDTWWQTETGGILITPLPGAHDLKPGSATKPFFGVQPCLVNDEGQKIEGPGQGALCIEHSWPGQMRTLYKNHERFEETYFSQHPGKYFSGDGAQRDQDGFYWITGRMDDVLNVSGHRMGTAEIESSLVAHEAVSEAAVVGFPHDIKGEGIYAFVTLKAGALPSPELKQELVHWVKSDIGPIAAPDQLQWSPQLPKTRSGKIMRRLLRKIANGEHDQLGDTSTLADPQVVQELVSQRLSLSR